MPDLRPQGDSSVRQQAIRGTLWLGSSRMVTQLATWLVTLLVVRMLSPSDYGLFGFATLVTGIVELAAELGLGAAIVQKSELDSDAFDTLFWTSIAMGLFVFGVTWLAAPAIARFFRQGELIDVLRVTMIGFVIASARVVPWSLLTRQINFARRSTAEVTSTLVASVATLVLAYLGSGVWSLVIGLLCRSLLLTLLCVWLMPWRPRWRFSLAHLEGTIRFGAEVSAARVVWYLYSNADFLIVGKMLGQQALGLYSLVFQLAVLPTERITSIVGQVAFPVYSRIQHQPDRFARYFLEILTLTSMVTFPIMTGLLVTADLGVLLLLPPAWHAVAAPLQVMCLVGMVMSVSTLVAPAVLAKGRAGIVLRFNLFCLSIMPIGFVVGARFGLIGVCWAWLLLFPFMAAVWFHMTRKLLGCTWRQLVGSLAPAAAASALMLATLLLLRHLAGSLQTHWMLVLLIGVGVITYVAALALCFPSRVAAARQHLRLRASE